MYCYGDGMAIKRLDVRMPDDLHAAIKGTAEHDRRSLNSQIIWLLEMGLANYDWTDSRDPRVTRTAK